MLLALLFKPDDPLVRPDACLCVRAQVCGHVLRGSGLPVDPEHRFRRSQLPAAVHRAAGGGLAQPAVHGAALGVDADRLACHRLRHDDLPLGHDGYFAGVLRGGFSGWRKRRPEVLPHHAAPAVSHHAVPAGHHVPVFHESFPVGGYPGRPAAPPVRRKCSSTSSTRYAMVDFRDGSRGHRSRHVLPHPVGHHRAEP